jgi:hypothetical protein
MAQVTLWSRDLPVGVPGVPPGAELVAVTYSTTTIPPRSVLLPLSAYREATDPERVANPRLHFYPKDKAAQDLELKAIREDLGKVEKVRPPTLEVP